MPLPRRRHLAGFLFDARSLRGTDLLVAGGDDAADNFLDARAKQSRMTAAPAREIRDGFRPVFGRFNTINIHREDTRRGFALHFFCSVRRFGLSVRALYSALTGERFWRRDRALIAFASGRATRVAR